MVHNCKILLNPFERKSEHTRMSHNDESLMSYSRPHKNCHKPCGHFASGLHYIKTNWQLMQLLCTLQLPRCVRKHILVENLCVPGGVCHAAQKFTDHLLCHQLYTSYLTLNNYKHTNTAEEYLQYLNFS